jgi:flagella basal body P-ring formation protein FlgA
MRDCCFRPASPRSAPWAQRALAWASRVARIVGPALGLVILPVHAQQAASEQVMRAWATQGQQWVEAQLASAAPPAHGLRLEAQVGPLDSRLQLAPCARVEPYLPTGTRLWGRSRMGLRCVQGPVHWNVFLPITVRAWGPAWVVTQPVQAGTRLAVSDLEPTEIDWAESATPVLARQDDWLGLEVTRPLVPGLVLRQGMVRPPQVFTAGSQIRVLIRGQGFHLYATGAALSHGHLGQTARIRMPNRRVLTGTVLDRETVEITL